MEVGDNMDAFIARKEENQIVVVGKGNLLILRFADEIRRIEGWNGTKSHLKRLGYDIEHVPSDAPELKEPKRVKKVEIPGQKVVLEEEEG